VRFYKNEAEAEAASDNRACHRLLLAEWRDSTVQDPVHLARNSVHPEYRPHVPGLVARAGLTAWGMRGTAQDAVRQLRTFADHHAAKAGVPYIPPADREAWGQSAEALKTLADKAQALLNATGKAA
jgi:hypothetical protein